MRERRLRLNAILFIAVLAAQSLFAATELHINGDALIFTDTIPFSIEGTSNLPRATVVRIVIAGAGETTALVSPNGTWRATWTTPLASGNYEVSAIAGGVVARQMLRVQLPGRLPRQTQQPPAAPRVTKGPLQPEPPRGEEITDRWRIAAPAYEMNEKPRRAEHEVLGKEGATLDPYHQNLIKGDRPIRGNDLFLSIGAVADTLAESRSVPTHADESGPHPGRVDFFGRDAQNFYQQVIAVSADLFQGDTAFQPIRQRVKATLIANLNHLQVSENAIVRPDVRQGDRRTDTQVSLQELFYERKLFDLSPAYDFVSVRVGSQPFSSDFRGLIFSDTNLGVRLFGNARSNRLQYNVAYFDRLEKDTNSGLNVLDSLRDQKVAVANFYVQDFGTKGYTQELSIHALRDGASTHYDRNGVLVRPAPVGVLQPHRVEAVYFGEAGLGHIGRINVDQALYYVVGHDSLNPIAGYDPELGRGNRMSIGAGMAAMELSYDRDWFRPRAGFFYATGDDDPRDRNGRGFDSIFDAQTFAGGGFSFFNRLGMRLAGSGLALVERGSLLPSLRSSKLEGQPNFVNPGLQLVTAGFDVDLTPRLKTSFTANYLRFDKVETLEAVLFQDRIRRELGSDLSLGFIYRPYLNNNVVIVLGGAAFLPGAGFTDLYEKDDTLFHVFTNLTFTF